MDLPITLNSSFLLSHLRMVWSGDNTSLHILPRLQLDWNELQRGYQRTGKPIGDLGCSFSTLSVEGFYEILNVFPLIVYSTVIANSTLQL